MKYQYDTARPYLASFVILRNSKDEIALVLRKSTGWMDGNYGLPSGKVEEDEPFMACAIREAKEEAEVDIDPADLQYAMTMHRYEKGQNNWVDVFFVARKWSGEAYNAEPHKHGELKWFPVNQLPENMVPNVRDAIEQIEKGNVYREFGWEEA